MTARDDQENLFTQFP